MPAPCLDIKHLKTSRQYEGANLITRYWFEWQNRRNLAAIVLRLDLLDGEGNKLTEFSVKLPKVKITGYIPASDSSPQSPIYDSAVLIKIDDTPREVPPASFSYFIVEGLLKKSDTTKGEMDGIYEDLERFGPTLAK